MLCVAVSRPDRVARIDRVSDVTREAIGAGLVEALPDVANMLGVLGIGQRAGLVNVVQAEVGRLARAVGMARRGRVAVWQPIQPQQESAATIRGIGPGRTAVASVDGGQGPGPVG